MTEQYAFRFDEKVMTTDTNQPQRVLGFRSTKARDGRPQPFVLVEYCGAVSGAWYYPHELERVCLAEPKGAPLAGARSARCPSGSRG